MQPAIWIVTPCYSAAETLDRTIASVVMQSGDFRINYHVKDGGSTDGTREILERWHRLTRSGQLPDAFSNVHFTYSSSRDGGLYPAIVEGFNWFGPIPSDDWLTWINADDVLMPGACALMAGIASRPYLDKVRWVTGAGAVARDGLQLTQHRRLFAREIVAAGLCDGLHWNHIQQEGTFFRSSAWSEAGAGGAFDGFDLAGDWNLWRTLAQKTEIYTVDWPLGVFSKRAGQLSAVRRGDYDLEIEGTVSRSQRRTSLLDFSSKTLSALGLMPDYKTDRIYIANSSMKDELRYWTKKNFFRKRYFAFW